MSRSESRAWWVLASALCLAACGGGGGATSGSTTVALTIESAGLAPAGAGGFPGVGRDATPAEVAAWDIDVRPDFAGLPPGQGSVMDGEELWIAKCSSCHGDFGDANHVFPPLIGNTTRQDIATGRVAALTDSSRTRTTMMKVDTVSTLWDYIHRAMPWDAPKSLSHDEVYAILAYMLNLAEVVPDDYVLSHANMAEVQSRMPNRYGMTREHGLWKIDGEPDVRNVACMSNCAEAAAITSELPAHARDAHGNLADQMRAYGPIIGVQTVAGAEPAAPTAAVAAAGGGDMARAGKAQALIAQSGCAGCHGYDNRLLGPSFVEVAAKYAGQATAVETLADRIKNGGGGVWGQIPMPPQPHVDAADARLIAEWLAAGAAR
jgi:cytochrome c551/c552